MIYEVVAWASALLFCDLEYASSSFAFYYFGSSTLETSTSSCWINIALLIFILQRLESFFLMNFSASNLEGIVHREIDTLIHRRRQFVVKWMRTTTATHDLEIRDMPQNWINSLLGINIGDLFIHKKSVYNRLQRSMCLLDLYMFLIHSNNIESGFFSKKM